MAWQFLGIRPFLVSVILPVPMLAPKPFRQRCNYFGFRQISMIEATLKVVVIFGKRAYDKLFSPTSFPIEFQALQSKWELVKGLVRHMMGWFCEGFGKGD